MRLLLDTYIVLWWLADDGLLPPIAATVIADPATEVLVSAATAWEIAIKRAAGRLTAPHDLLGALAENDFDPLAITAAHALRAGDLPAHHGDPFDRMLIAQAQTESLTLVSVDRRFSDYDVELLALGDAGAKRGATGTYAAGATGSAIAKGTAARTTERAASSACQATESSGRPTFGGLSDVNAVPAASLGGSAESAVRWDCP